MAPLGWLLKHSRKCDTLRLKPLEHLEHHSRPAKKYLLCPSALHRLAREGGAKSPKDLSSGKRSVPDIRGVVQSSWGGPTMFLFDLTAACADPRTGLSPKLSSTSKWQTPVYFPKGSKEFPHFSSWEIALLSVSFLSASSFALSAFLTPISSSLYHLCCCPSFQNIPWNSDCSAVFCSRLVETQIL